MEDVNDAVIEVILSVVREQYPEVAEVRGEQGLVEDLGLKSLDLARIVAKLDMELGVEPFSEAVAITSIRTVGDLCAAYAQCFAADEAAPPEPEPQPDVQASPRGAAREAQKELRKRSRD